MMNKKAKFLAIGLVSLILTGVLGVGVFAGKGFFKVNQHSAKIDVDIAKNKKELKTDRLSPKNAKMEVVLDVKWGNGENEFIMSKYQEAPDTPSSYQTPSSYTVDSKGNIYVYDTLNFKLKVFNNNRLIRSIPLPKSNIPVVLRDMAVDSDGNIYGLNYLANELVKIDQTNKVEVVFKDLKLHRPETIDILSGGSIMIQDNVDSENATRVRKLDKHGNIISEKKMANIIDWNLYEYENQNGYLINLAPIGYRNHQIEMTDKETGARKAICNYSAMPISDDMECDSKLLGADKSGKVYFWVQDRLPGAKGKELGLELWRKQIKEYINSIDVAGSNIETFKIDNTDLSMCNSTANLSNRFIKMDYDGNIYQLMMNQDGYKIIKYSFS